MHINIGALIEETDRTVEYNKAIGNTRLIVPALPRFIEQNPELTVQMSMNDRLIDLVQEAGIIPEDAAFPRHEALEPPDDSPCPEES